MLLCLSKQTLALKFVPSDTTTTREIGNAQHAIACVIHVSMLRTVLPARWAGPFKVAAHL